MFELDANAIDTKHERALEAVLGDASGIGMHPQEGVRSEVDDGDWRCTFHIGYAVAAAIVHNGTVATASVLIEHVRDVEKDV